MSHDNHSTHSKKGIWYTYFGKGGAAVFAFLWVLAAILWIVSVINWG